VNAQASANIPWCENRVADEAGEDSGGLSIFITFKSQHSSLKQRKKSMEGFEVGQMHYEICCVGGNLWSNGKCSRGG
jgi:hypothetical protein